MIPFTAIPEAITEFKAGRFLIVMDETREKEGDLMIAADKVTHQALNFMRKKTSGLICVALHEEIIARLKIPLMPKHNQKNDSAAFTISVDAAANISTGASLADRLTTIRVLLDPASTSKDITLPGHVFPLQAKSGGVLTRAGHTEAGVDLALLAGLSPAVLLSEVMNESGHIASFSELVDFSREFDIKMVSIHDLIAYRFAAQKECAYAVI